MKTTMTLSASLNCNPFEIFNQDCDEVIMLINFYIALGDEENTTELTPAPEMRAASKEKRIKVNDKTATGGWF